MRHLERDPHTHTPEANVQGPQDDTHEHNRAPVDAEHDDGGDVQHNVGKVEKVEEVAPDGVEGENKHKNHKS